MIKRLSIYAITFTVAFLVFFLHQYVLGEAVKNLPYDLRSVYLFFAICSFIITVLLFLLSNTSSFRDQVGFIFLGAVVVKMMLFFVMYKSTVMVVDTLSRKHNLNLLIPIILFVFLEVYFVSKRLNEMHFVKKE